SLPHSSVATYVITRTYLSSHTPLGVVTSDSTLTVAVLSGQLSVAVGAGGTITDPLHSNSSSRLPGALSHVGAVSSNTVIVTVNGTLSLPHSSVATYVITR